MPNFKFPIKQKTLKVTKANGYHLKFEIGNLKLNNGFTPPQFSLMGIFKKGMFGRFNFKFFGKQSPVETGAGFTLIELLVVLSIMGILTVFFTMNIYNQRVERDLKITQNELASNIRKVQSYSLAARTLPNGQSPNYYVIRFDLSRPDRYTIQGIYNVYSNPQLLDVETIVLPKDTVIRSVVVTRSSSLTPSSFTLGTSYSCALLAFKLPFAKMYADSIGFEGDGPGDCLTNSPQTITTASRYNDFLKFIVNINSVTVSTDFSMVITLANTRVNMVRQVWVRGATGNVTSL